MQFIDLKTQYAKYKKDIDIKIQEILNHGKYIMGPEVEEIEEKLAEFVGVKHCISVGSGTVSLEIALRALDIGPGDEVITVPFTWISSAEVIMAVGAKPVFVDIEADTYNLNPSLLEAAINKKTRAIMPVSLFGQIPNMNQIGEIASRYQLPIIEDAAQSFGATSFGKKSCGLSLIGSTSFFPAKVFGCYGDGGALFSDNDDLACRMKAIRNHGAITRGHHNFVGLNGRFDTLQAGVLLAKLPYFMQEINSRSRIGSRYTDKLRDVCTTPIIAKGNTHVYAQYTIRTSKRDSLKADLNKKGIPTAIHYSKCLHEQPIFEGLGYKWGSFPEAEKASREVISLPMHPFLQENEQDLIISAVLKSLS